MPEKPLKGPPVRLIGRPAIPPPSYATKAASGPRKGRRAVSIPAMWTHGKSKRKGV